MIKYDWTLAKALRTVRERRTTNVNESFMNQLKNLQAIQDFEFKFDTIN
jgi:hypothetical protein